MKYSYFMFNIWDHDSFKKYDTYKELKEAIRVQCEGSVSIASQFRIIRGRRVSHKLITTIIERRNKEHSLP